MEEDILVSLREANKGKSKGRKWSFFECREDIKRGLEAGYSMRQIWEVLTKKGKLSYSYPGFTKAVRAHLKGEPKPDKVAPPPPAETVSEPQKGYTVVRREVNPEEAKVPPKVADTATNKELHPSIAIGLAKLRKGVPMVEVKPLK